MEKLVLVLEISGLVIASLIAFGLIMTSVRALIGGKFDIESPFSLADEATAEQRASKESWVHRMLVAFDQMCNVIFFRGYPDETISAHAYRASLKGRWWGIAMNRWLEWIQSDHGAKAAAGDHYRAIAVAAIEKQALEIK